MMKESKQERCSVIACACEGPYYAPVLIFRIDDQIKSTVSASVPLTVCVRHVVGNSIGIPELVDDATWVSIDAMFSKVGLSPPVRHLTRLDWQISMKLEMIG